MSMNTSFHIAAALTASFTLLSCASTQLSHTWRDASYTAGPLKKILVLAVRRDQTRRRAWESSFAAVLSSSGVDATPSIYLMTEASPSKEFIDSIAKKGDYDGIILVGRTSSKITDEVTASTDLASLDSPSETWGGWSSEYNYHEFYPGYPIIHETVRNEVKLWAARGGERLIWSGVGEVLESGQDEDVSGEIITLIVKKLVKEGLIAA